MFVLKSNIYQFVLLTIPLLSGICTFSQDRFSDIAEISNIDHTYGEGANGGGVSFYDFNEDGWDDLTFATSEGEELHFYLNKTGEFERVYFSIENIYDCKQVLWVDFDNDGDSDLFVTSLGKNLLYRNNGEFVFDEVTEQFGLPLSEKWTYSAAWGDYNRDGWLDLYITDKAIGVGIEERSNHLYENVKGEYFSEISTTTTSDQGKAPFAVAFLDINNDSWQDIYIAQDKHKSNTLLKKQEDKSYSDIGKTSNADLAMDGMCVTVADYNNDQFLDIYVTNTEEGNALFRNNGDDTFSEVGSESGVGLFQVGWGSSFFDYDNDGLQDLYVCNMLGKNGFYRNLDKVRFDSLVNMGFEKDTVISFSCATGDLNNDGYSDIAVCNAKGFKSTLWKNPGSYNNNWIKVTLDGKYSNKDAVGSRIVAYSGTEIYTRYLHSGIGYLSQNSQHEIIGIAHDNVIDSLKINWLSGIEDVFYDVQPNLDMLITEGENHDFSPSLNISGHIELCDNENITLNCGYFSDSFKYHWSSGDSSMITTINEDGIYYVDLEDSYGERYRSDTVVVNLIESPSISKAITTNLSCHDSSDGMIELEVSNGTPPYEVNWGIGENGLTINNLPHGEYCVDVRDEKNCEATGSYVIFNPEMMQANVSIDPSLDIIPSGIISISVSGGVPPYVYYLNDHIVQSKIEEVPSGVYNIVVTDVYGCSKNINVEVPIITETSLNDFLGSIIYPNPVSDYIFIKLKLNKEAEITLTNLLGTELVNLKVMTSSMIDVKGFECGTYLIKIDDNPASRIVISR